MIVLGLTGSIGMGKSAAASAFRRLGIPVYDADRAVHRLTRRGGAAVAAVEKAFPGVVKNGAVDRVELGGRVFKNPAALKRLEAILHPMVRAEEGRFLTKHRARRTPVVVLDIPLLLETGGEKRCDAVIVVSAPQFLQDRRVMKRPGMTRERLAEVKAQQMPDAEKRRRADFVVQTGLDRRSSMVALRRVLERVKRR
jgi:dephospho-CoA kinase